MTTETVLTDAQIFDCFDRECAEMVINFDADELYPVGRAIEQAVLQSEQVQAWKKDAGRYRIAKEAICESPKSFAAGLMSIPEEHFSSEFLDFGFDAAMEKQTC